MSQVVVTDTQFRKGFDVCNVVRHLGYELVPLISEKGFWQWLKLGFGLPEKVQHLGNDNIDQFRDGLKLIEEKAKASLGPICLIPCEEKTVRLLAEHPHVLDQFPEIVAMVPEQEAFDIAVDKGHLMNWCLENSLPSPRTFLAPESIVRELNTRIGQPRKMVLKPRMGTGATGIEYLETSEDFRRVASSNNLNGYLLQDFVENKTGVEGAFFLCQQGEVVSSYSHNRIRTYPDGGGVTVYSQVTANEDIIKLGSTILKKLNWNGFAMIEFIFDLTDNCYKVIEINPRLWGSVLLGDFAGARMIENYVKLCLGETLALARIEQPKYIRWFFPYDVMLWIKRRGKIEGFWKRDVKNTCYVGLTYTRWWRGWAFQFFNVFDSSNIGKFLNRLSGKSNG